MKKLLAITALAALALTGCGASTGKPPSGPPALIQPTQEAPASKIRKLADVADNYLYEVTGTNADGMPFRCYISEGYQAVSQTCFEYAKP